MLVILQKEPRKSQVNSTSLNSLGAVEGEKTGLTAAQVQVSGLCFAQASRGSACLSKQKVLLAPVCMCLG